MSCTSCTDDLHSVVWEPVDLTAMTCVDVMSVRTGKSFVVSACEQEQRSDFVIYKAEKYGRPLATFHRT